MNKIAPLKAIFAIPLTIIHYLVYGLILLIFWPLQWISLKLFGYNGHKKSVDLLNICLNSSLFFLASRIKINNDYKLPTDRPLIIVANHQSHYDINPLGHTFRNHHPKYISKIELGSGIPSVSFNLKHGGSVLIDRKDSKQALGALRDFGKYLEENKYSGVIFPEGTRSKNGEPKRFSENGLKMLLKFAPSALVIPVSINNSWKVMQYGSFPLDIGNKLEFDVQKAIDPKGRPFDEVFKEIELAVKNGVETKQIC
jgi:1-acyl-sn-glycerol-3-phosphate acyltransferase